VNLSKIDPDRLLTSTEVGELLQVNSSSVKNWVNEGRLTAFRTPGGHRRIRASDLVEFLAKHKMPIPTSLESAGRKRLLIVDDDMMHLRTMGRLVNQRYQDRVHVALTENGIDALVMVGSFKPHLIVLDVFMPELDGLEVCRRLKANPGTRDIQVIVASGHLTAEVEDNAMRAGARRCLTKPIDIDLIIEELGIPLSHSGRKTGAL
jgi:excisionase family DNA binding protein